MLKLDSKAVLESIEAQHGLLEERTRGIYSFSHLTFHEYFTANKIVTSVGANGCLPLEALVTHITELRWREVFLLTVQMLDSADELLWLMKKRIDALVAADNKSQQFLLWVNNKSLLEAPYKSADIRAFYFALGCEHTAIYAAVHPVVDRGLTLSCQRIRDLSLDYMLVLVSAFTIKYELVCARDLAFEFNPALGQALQQLNEQLPSQYSEEEKFDQWRNEGKLWVWTEKLKKVMNDYRDIKDNWHFNEQQEEALIRYYDANWLLADCLNSGCNVSSEVKEEIEETLLLPISEIESRQQGKVS